MATTVEAVVGSRRKVVGVLWRLKNFVLNLPTEKNWDGSYLYQYQGFWCPSRHIHGTISFQRRFQAQDTDIILTSFPKSGTTWLKALTFTIVNRFRYELKDSPLLTTSPHDLLPVNQIQHSTHNQTPTLEEFPTPRIFATHIPYASLPVSIVNSNCRIVYICRNPLDQFISNWHFLLELREQTKEPISLDEAFEMICNGIQAFGPIWDHVLGYWKASAEKPHKILFLKYEDLKVGINFYVKKLADFLGCPFSKEEESRNVIEEISKFCSFDNMKKLEVNKNGRLNDGIKTKVFFRKGLVGDHTNYLNSSMSERLDKILEEKLGGSGFTFKKP
ncbi:cytosolic sulfotransferase 15-like [Pistacia vera]|uniref:cytosolic sulfotransferase 15-like n=1 Tax=Pistacia vera TaxID=55513 RepID=UPI0012638206|nr:cytosolic sulfotransferase 15-like [Pistacia vera]